jgi:hypothetical protein
MRDKNLDNIKFCDSLDGYFASVPDRCLELRKQVVDSSNSLNGEYYLTGLPKKRNELIGLAIASWYAPEEVRWLIQFELEEAIKLLCLEDQFIFEIILSSKAEMILFLIETDLYHTRSFFGNIAVQGRNAMNKLRYLKVNKKVVQPQRKRGYHDHGSLVPNHNWLPKQDHSLTELHNEIETKRSIYHQTVDFIRGILE